MVHKSERMKVLEAENCFLKERLDAVGEATTAMWLAHVEEINKLKEALKNANLPVSV